MSQTERMVLGARGEAFACEYLQKNGYKIIERNVRCGGGEIDIIVRAKNRTLVFVEVKSLRRAQGTLSEKQLVPEDEMTRAKIKKFSRAALWYANAHAELVDTKVGWRLDVLALTARGDSFTVSHYENIF